MRFIVLAIILASLPVIINLLRQNPQKRPLAMMAIGFMLFCGGEVQIEASIIGWPLWNGVTKGIFLSPVDSICIALLLTRSKKAFPKAFWFLFAIYGIALLLSIVPATVPMATFFVWWQYARILLLFAAVAGECEHAAARSGLIKGFAVGLMLQAGYVIWQKAHGVVQATGTLYHQNTLGMMVELAIIPLVAALFGGERSKVAVMGVIAGLLVIAGGGSRAAMGMASAGIAVLTVLSLIRSITSVKLKIVGIGALVMAIAAPVGVMSLRERFGAESFVTEEEGRASFERAATAMAADHPIGVGANLYVATANLKGYADRAGVAWNFANRSAPVHNAYLLARAESGWLGEIGYILLLVMPIAWGLKSAFALRTLAAGELVLGATVALGVTVVHNNYEFAGATYFVQSLAFVNIGIIASAKGFEFRRRRATALRRRSIANQPARPAVV